MNWIPQTAQQGLMLRPTNRQHAWEPIFRSRQLPSTVCSSLGCRLAVLTKSSVSCNWLSRFRDSIEGLFHVKHQ